MTVTVGADGDSAVEGTDYETVNALTIEIPAGAARGTTTFTLTPTNDQLVEGTETISVTGTSSGGETVTGEVINLTDDDTAPTGITLTATPDTVAENVQTAPTVTVTATVNGSTRYVEKKTVTVTVGADGDSAVEGTDYETVNALTIEIPAGAARGTTTFTLTPTNDQLVEGTETISVTGTSSGGETVTGEVISLTDDDMASTGITLTASPDTVAENVQTAPTVTVTATVNGSTRYVEKKTVTVTVGADGDSAVEGTDYETVNALTIEIPAGAARGTTTFTLTPTNDQLVEGTETISVTGTSSGGETVTGEVINLTDDDTAPTGITLTATPDTVAENVQTAPTVTVTATVNGSTRYVEKKTVTVAVGADGDSAVEGTDYETVNALTIEIVAGAASGMATFTLTPTNDQLVESTETISVTGTSSGGETVTGEVINLTDDDTASTGITLTASPDTVAENVQTAPTVTVTATVNGSTRYVAKKTVTVTVGADGDSAVEGTDYETVNALTIEIPAGAASGATTFTLTPTNDQLVEGTETISVTGTSSGGETVTGEVINLTDDDTDDDTASSGITLTATPDMVAENVQTAPTVTMTATVNGSTRYVAKKTVTVTVGADGDSAVEGTDYETVNDFTIEIAAGAARGMTTFTLTPTNDQLVEGTETISVTGTSSGGEIVTGEVISLTDDDTAPIVITPSFSIVSIADTTVDEGGIATFVVTRAGATGTVVSVRAATAEHVGGEHPASTSDYVPVTVPHTLSFGAGETRKIFSVQTMEDTLDEPDETFMARLSGATSNAVIAADGAQAIGTIMDDGQPPAISIADAVPVVESATASFPIRLSAVSDKTIAVEWVTSPGTATEDADYVGGKGTIAIAAGSTDATIEVATIDDTEIEGKKPETFTVTLLNPVNVTIDEPVATGTIEDDDYLAAVARIKRVNTAMLPRVGSALMRSRIDQLADCIDHAATGNGIVGLSALGESLSRNAEALNRGELSLQEALAGTRLAAKVPVNRDRPGSGDMTFCAGGDWRRLSSIDDSPVTWEGNLFGAHVGGNMRLGNSVLLGLDVSHHTSSLDWGDEAGAEVFAGDWRMRLNAVHPYVTWFTSQGLRLSAMAGYGSGHIRIVEETGLDQPADLTLKSVALGGVLPLETSRGDTSLRFRGDAWLGELKVEDNGSLVEGLSVVTQGVRVLAEGKWRVDLGDDASLAPSTRIGLQYDDGAGGLGLEVGSGLRWASPTHGLSAALSGRFLLVRDGIREWGMSADVRLAPTQGLGPSFTFSPSWGATADGTEALWEHGLEAASHNGHDLAAPSLTMESGWGLRLSDGRGVLMPFVGLSLSGEDARRMRLGGRLEVNRFSLEVAGMRRERGSTAPDHGLYLKVVASW